MGRVMIFRPGDGADPLAPTRALTRVGRPSRAIALRSLFRAALARVNVGHLRCQGLGLAFARVGARGETGT